MKGLFLNPETQDIEISENGSFIQSDIDSQNCALISLSQICRITKTYVGESLAAKMFNRTILACAKDLAQAKKAVESDGGKNVIVQYSKEYGLIFKADYL